MYSWLVTVLLLASAAYCSGGARVPITRYTCTQPDHISNGTFTDDGQCNISSGLRTCETEGGVRPKLLNGDTAGTNNYVWANGANPFVVLDIPQGWCVGSVKMTFLIGSNIPPTLSLSVHSAERLSTNTSRTMFSLVSGQNSRGKTLAVINLTTLACGSYLRINVMTSALFYLAEIEVLGTNNVHPSSAGGNPVGPTTSVGSSTHSVAPISTSANSTTSGPVLTPSYSSSIPSSNIPVVQDNYILTAAISVVAVLLVVVLIAIFVVVICIVTRRRKTRKSLKVQHLPIHYRSTQSDVTFGDSQFPVSQSAEVPTHATNGAVDNSHDGEIMGTPHNNTALGPSTSPSTPIYGNVGPLSSSPMPAAAQPPKRCSPPKPPHSAKSPSVPQEDHIYTEVDKSHKMSASSASSPPANLTHSTDATQVDGTNASADTLYDDLYGGSGNLEGNDVGQPESITSSTTGVGAVPTQAAAMGIIYTEVDYSKKSRRGEER